MSDLRKTVPDHVMGTMSNTKAYLARWIVMAIGIGCLGGTDIGYALNPSHETEFRSSLAKLAESVARLDAHFSEAFQPDASKEAGGDEEIAWRVRDLQEKNQRLETLSKDYWKNETGIFGILDQ